MAPVGKLRYSCRYPKCLNKYYHPIFKETYTNKHFYNFPKNELLLEKWKKACGIAQNINCSKYHICEDHFNLKDFKNSTKHKLNYKVVPINSTPNIESNSTLLDHNYCVSPNLSSNIESDARIISLLSSTSEFEDNQTVSTSAVEDCTLIVNHRISSNSNVECSVTPFVDKYAFLSANKHTGIVTEIGLPENKLRTKKSTMYVIHQNIASKLSKLRSLLNKEKNVIKKIKRLYNDGKFKYIEDNLNVATKEFINCLLRNTIKKPLGTKWTEYDKIFSLSMYKRSPRLYRYLQANFHLPSVGSLKGILSSIPFQTGINKQIIQHLKLEVDKLKPCDKTCALLFDEISLSSGLHYEETKQYISGYEDLGHLGRSLKEANHALVFMVRGLRKNWKQPIAYYFTSGTVQSIHLKDIIVTVIKELQNIGLNIVTTVCKLSSTNRKALWLLCKYNKCPYYFTVNNRRVCTVFDVPHLLKDTRNALFRCHILYDKTDNTVKLEYIQSAFDIDQSKRSFRQLIKLKKEYFDFEDSCINTKVAAATLSHTVAASIESLVASGELPTEAIYTAEFVDTIDSLFDSLNGSTFFPPDHKKYRCALSECSPHLKFWLDMLYQINKWQLIDMKSGINVTSDHCFVTGWQTTIKSIIYIWNHLKDQEDFEFLPLRQLNQDPLENLFSVIRQHGTGNPFCHQFVAALKTAIISSDIVGPYTIENCEADECTSLSSLKVFSQISDETAENPSDSEEVHQKMYEKFDFDKINDLEDNKATVYIAGFLLTIIDIPDCPNCKSYLVSDQKTNKHLILFNENPDFSELFKHPSDAVIQIVDKIHHLLYGFLRVHRHELRLEDNFRYFCKNEIESFQSCKFHKCHESLLNKCIKLFIYKFAKTK